MEESSGASGQLLKAAMAFASHNMAGLLEARSLDDLSDPCCRQLSRFYTEEMRICGRRFTPHSESPTSSELRETAATSGRLYFCARHFLSKKENVHLFFLSSFPRFDKCHETSRIFPRTEQTFASARSFGVIS